MIDLPETISSTDYSRLFRMLSTVNREAESLKLSNLVHLTNMALLQLSLDWEGVQAEDEKSAKINTIFRNRARMAIEEENFRN